jgi:hypothetical protein
LLRPIVRTSCFVVGTHILLKMCGYALTECQIASGESGEFSFAQLGRNDRFTQNGTGRTASSRRRCSSSGFALCTAAELWRSREVARGSVSDAEVYCGLLWALASYQGAASQFIRRLCRRSELVRHAVSLLLPLPTTRVLGGTHQPFVAGSWVHIRRLTTSALASK